MTIRFPVDRLDVYCATRRDGFGDAVRACATIAGGSLSIDAADWRRLTDEYRLQAKPFGLGDAVASVAQPIAGILDSVLGTHIKGCGGCEQRRETLNRIVPDLRH